MEAGARLVAGLQGAAVVVAEVLVGDQVAMRGPAGAEEAQADGLVVEEALEAHRTANHYLTSDPDQVGLELAVVVAVQGCLVLVPLHPQPPKPRNSDEEVPRPPRKQEQARPLQLAPEKRGGGLGGAAVVEEVVLLVEEGVEIARAVALAEPRVLQCLGWGLPLAYQVTPSKLLLGPAAVVVVALLIGQMWAGQAGLAMILALRLELGVAEVFVVVAVWMAWAALHHLQVGQLVSSLAGKVACSHLRKPRAFCGNLRR